MRVLRNLEVAQFLGFTRDANYYILYYYTKGIKIKRRQHDYRNLNRRFL